MKDPIAEAKEQIECEMLYERATGIPRCHTEISIYRSALPQTALDFTISASTKIADMPKNVIFVGHDIAKFDDSVSESFNLVFLKAAAKRAEDNAKSANKTSFPFEYLAEKDKNCVS